MRAFSGNNCAKGCLIYLFAFVLIVVVSSMGLSGLSSRFGVTQVQGIKPALTVPQAEQGLAALQSQPPGVIPDGFGGGLPLTPVGLLPTVAPSQPGPQPTAAPQPTTAPPPPQPGQGGTISGGTSPSFYIVQPGDSLWAISQKFGVSVDALRAANNITGDIIYPGEIIYLPIPGQSAAPFRPTPGASSGTQPDSGAGDQGQSQDAVPGMPGTGITSRKP
jgi:LysM repeat protein